MTISRMIGKCILCVFLLQHSLGALGGLKQSSVKTWKSQSSSLGVSGQREGCAFTYSVRKGETIFALSQRFGMKKGDFYRMNRIKKNGVLAIGQSLCIVSQATPMTASFYADKFHKRKTSSGELFDKNGLTAAHKTFPIGTILKVFNRKSGRYVQVRVNDRGPFKKGRDLDLSPGVAKYLKIAEAGVEELFVRVVFMPQTAPRA